VPRVVAPSHPLRGRPRSPRSSNSQPR
jgi:hypothetical protein